MTISPLTIYLWRLADRVISVSVPVTVALAFLTIILVGISSDCEGVTRRTLLKSGVASFVAFLTSLATYTLTPSSDTVAMMVVIPQIAESKVVQKDIPELYNVAIEALKGQMKGNP